MSVVFLLNALRTLQQATGKAAKNTVKTTLVLALVVGALLNGSSAWAYTPQALYDDVWKLLNTRFLDQHKNGQDWRIWRHRYDAELKTDADAYVAIDTMVASLGDRFTRFLNPEEFAEEGQSIKASLFGIGIQIGLRDEKLVVIAPMEDTPAEKAGLKPNDEILEIDGKTTQGMSIKDAADHIRGEKGTKVKLLVKRGTEKNKLYTVERDEIKLKSVSTKHPFELTLPPEVAYIKLSSFLSSNASIELLEALEKNKEKQAFIIDLRSNPGGLLSNAITIADFFLEEGGIVSTVDRDGYKEVRESEPDLVTDKPVVLLIDEGSASASEILSGALKDNHRATLIGRRSFGKGLVQEINQLPGGAGINITTQKYLTPKDIDIHKKGIKPDVDVKFGEEDFKAKRDPQLNKALEVLGETLSLTLKATPSAATLKLQEEEKALEKTSKKEKALPNGKLPKEKEPTKVEPSAVTPTVPPSKEESKESLPTPAVEVPGVKPVEVPPVKEATPTPLPALPKETAPPASK